eukprot:3791692-Rhodomonas_salina.1
MEFGKYRGIHGGGVAGDGVRSQGPCTKNAPRQALAHGLAGGTSNQSLAALHLDLQDAVGAA